MEHEWSRTVESGLTREKALAQWAMYTKHLHDIGADDTYGVVVQKMSYGTSYKLVLVKPKEE